jgi:hypothetical protein
MHSFRQAAAAAAFACLAMGTAAAEENYESWGSLVNPFESTGGGGIMIGEYRPVVVGDRCTTNFTATEPGPGGKIYYNSSSIAWPCRAASCARTAGGRRSTAACRARRRFGCSSRMA